MEVVLIRHTSVDVPKGTCYGQTDVPVAATFEQEAAVTRAELEKHGPFDAVFSSPLTRALKLAAFCGCDHPVADDRLKEMFMGNWEMKRFDLIDDPNLEKWYNNYVQQPTTGGESFQDVYHRVAEFFDELKPKGYSRVAIFAHGGVLLCAGLYAKLYTTGDMFKHLVPYGGILTLNL